MRHENIKIGHAASIITTSVKSDILLQLHGDVISICQSPHQQLFAVRQMRLHSHAAPVVVLNVSKFVQSGLFPSVC